MGVTTVKGRTLNGNVETLPFINPATSIQFGEVVTATLDDVKTAHREMKASAKIWAARPLKERIRILRKLQKLILDETDEITAVINEDNGKSRQDALLEVFVTVDLMAQYLKQAPQWLARRRVSPGLQIFKRCYVEQVPLGVTAVISPWNYPFVLTIPPVFAALLAGNTVLVKPSEVTGATGVMMEKLFSRIPELAPAVKFLHGDGRVGAAIVQSNPDLIYFTGAVATGKKIAKMAADNLTPFIFELGSKDPMIVLEDADVQAAAKWGVWGAFFNTGQACISVERVYVVAAVYDQFIQAVLAEVEQLKIGYSPALDNQFDMGPFTFQRQIEIVENHLEDALARGAKIAAGGQRDGMFMQPTVVVDVDHTMHIMKDETFGPVMPIMKVDDELHAIQLANDSYMGLGASVWSQDLKRAERVAQQLETGSININDTISHFGIPNLPFGGVKESGHGRSHGQEDLLQFTFSKSYVVSQVPRPYDVGTILRRPGTYGISKAIMKLAFGVTPQQRLEPITDLLPVKTEEESSPQVTKMAALLGGVAALTAVVIAINKLRK